MDTSKFSTYRHYAMAAGLAMALGPLTALSVASLNNESIDGPGVAVGDPPTVEYDATDAVTDGYGGKRLADVAAGAGSLDLFGSILAAADLDELLHGQEQYTVFIPVNEAFSRLGGERFSALLGDPSQARELAAAHVVPGRITTATLLAGPQLRTISGSDIRPATGPSLKVNGVAIIGSEVAENGVVHYVDGLL